MATRTIDLLDAQQHLAELVRQVEAGIEIILTDGNTPRARLVAVQSRSTQRIAGLHQGSIHTSPDFDEPLPDTFWQGTP